MLSPLVSYTCADVCNVCNSNEMHLMKSSMYATLMKVVWPKERKKERRHERGLIEKKKGMSGSVKGTRMDNEEKVCMMKMQTHMKMS